MSKANARSPVRRSLFIRFIGKACFNEYYEHKDNLTTRTGLRGRKAEGALSGAPVSIRFIGKACFNEYYEHKDNLTTRTGHRA